MSTDAVSVGTDSTTLHPNHFGTAFDMSEYEEKVHNIFATVTFMPTTDLRIYSTVAFNKSEGSFDEIDFGESVEEATVELPESDFDFSDLYKYSDLSYQLLSAIAGFDYKLTPTVTLTVDGTYVDLTDDAPWVFGDESGSYFMVRTGVRIDF